MLMNTDWKMQVVVENCKAKNLSVQSSPGCRVAWCAEVVIVNGSRSCTAMGIQRVHSENGLGI